MRTRIGVALALVLFVAGLLALPVVARPVLSRWVWNELSTRLERTFDARLTIETFDVHLIPSIRVEGRGLRLYQRRHPDAPPLVSVQQFSAITTLMRLSKGKLQRVSVEGLDITIPAGGRPSLKKAPSGESPPDSDAGERGLASGGISVDEIVSTGARLVVTPGDPDGVPLEFGVENVRLTGFSGTAPAQFEAQLINPKPRGKIIATGSFGPWQVADPRQTALDGRYKLEHADMSVFKGIGGTLDSVGTFRGVLSDIAVQGSATMPDFTVETGNFPMPLTTDFSARVNGTNGNTYLERVSVMLGESPLEATGEIAGRSGTPGKTIKLHVKSNAARLTDLIALVVRQRPVPMHGQLALDTRLELPPGDEPVVDVLRLDGRFTIARGRFASDSVQDRVDELSRRGRGQPKNESIENVLSTFSGRFALRQGVLTLPHLQFAVRGAEVRLAGSYALRGERLGFSGELRLQARVSQTTTGFKSLLLKVVDPFFRKHGAGAVLPIRVGGTVAAPEFGLQLFGRKSG